MLGRPTLLTIPVTFGQKQTLLAAEILLQNAKVDS